MIDINLRRLFLISLIASVSASALIGIGVLVFGDFGYFEIRVMMTTLTITAMSILGLASGAYLETGRSHTLPTAGIAFSIAAGVLTFLIIWNVADESEIFIKVTATATLIAVACSHLSLISLARLDNRFAWTRIAAKACVWTLAAILLFIMWFEPDGESDFIFRVIGILTILIAAITVITPVLHRLSSASSPDAVESIDNEITVLKARLAHLEAQRSRLTSELKADS